MVFVITGHGLEHLNQTWIKVQRIFAFYILTILFFMDMFYHQWTQKQMWLFYFSLKQLTFINIQTWEHYLYLQQMISKFTPEAIFNGTSGTFEEMIDKPLSKELLELQNKHHSRGKQQINLLICYVSMVSVILQHAIFFNHWFVSNQMMSDKTGMTFIGYQIPSFVFNFIRIFPPFLFLLIEFCNSQIEEFHFMQVQPNLAYIGIQIIFNFVFYYNSFYSALPSFDPGLETWQISYLIEVAITLLLAAALKQWCMYIKYNKEMYNQDTKIQYQQDLVNKAKIQKL